MSAFEQLGLSAATLQAIYGLGFEEPTPIQEKAIPVALAGNDVIGKAPTGTGKTAAFGLPIIEKITLDSDHIQGLVVVPTRELAIQVAEELNKIGEYKKVRATNLRWARYSAANKAAQTTSPNCCRYSRTIDGPYAPANNPP